MKLIIDIPEEAYEYVKATSYLGWLTTSEYAYIIKNGTPLDSNSERAEVQAYFDGEAYGWEQGRKALIDDAKAEIETNLSWDMFDEYGNETRLHKELIEILDNIGKAESEDK
jgi:hypothetical protein